MESLEQEFMSLLRRLPTPITITWRSGLYHWQCEGGSGSAQRQVAAVEAALQQLLGKNAADRVPPVKNERQL
jgi:hypothetical protein